MNELKIFENQEFGKIRVVDQNGQPWFVAKDVCECLELTDVSKTISLLDDDEKGTNTVRTPGGEQQMLVVSEPGLYSIILRSRKPEAKAFKRWVTHDVIPSIRKTGVYGSVAIPDFNDPVEAAKAFIEMSSKFVEAEEGRRKEIHQKLALAQTVEQQKPLVQIAENRIDKKGCFSLTDVNKSLNLKRGEITNWAREKGFIHKRLAEVNRSGEKYFKVYSTNGVHNQIGVTEEGVQMIKNIFNL